jgi:DNA-binding response OmpR family regulator
VDDDADVLAAIDHVLSKRGIYVTAFEELDQALQHIRKNPPDLAIIDLLFPGASGFGLCEAIRSDPSISQMPLLILTAHSSQENIKKAVGLHINGFVAKPFDTEEFGERVLKMLRQTGKTIGG